MWYYIFYKIRQTSDTESCEILNEPSAGHNEALIALSSQVDGGVLNNHELNSQQLMLKDHHSHHNHHNHHHHHHHHNRHHRLRPRSRDLEQQSPSEHYPPSNHHLRRNNSGNNSGAQQHHQYHRSYSHQNQPHRDTNPHTDEGDENDDDNDAEDEEGHDDTEDNLADEEFEEDEVSRDVRQQKQIQINHLKENRHENMEDDDDDDEVSNVACRITVQDTAEISVEANVINDELKYGAGHKQMNTVDSNPLESQSEWSDEDCREEATGE